MPTQAIPNVSRVIAFVACASLLMTAAFGQSQTDSCNSVSITTSEDCLAKCSASSVGGVNCGNSTHNSSQFVDNNGQVSCYCSICSSYMCGETTPTCEPSSEKLSRFTWYPSQCVRPSSCNYMCNVGYLMTVSSACAVTVVPTYDGSSCNCFTGTGTKSGDNSSVAFPDSTSAVITKTHSSSADVVAQVDGVTCTGVYSSTSIQSTPPPTSKDSPTPPPTSSATHMTMSAGMVLVGVLSLLFAV
eukprot:m.25664 g.25664  ORF g.25664 m.25664 type:complete len:244 (+) comp15115_c0_seq1:182-913(+)